MSKSSGWYPCLNPCFRISMMILSSLTVTAYAADYVVTNAADSGLGSLRNAIVNANSNPGADSITFNLPFGTNTIAPASPLPALSDATGGTTIDGAGEITLDGNSAGICSGLTLSSDANIVKGLIICRFSSAGVAISGDGNFVHGCMIGLSSHLSVGNGIGVSVSGKKNRIGGSESKERNVIGGNNSHGIVLLSSAVSNVVMGNFIGTNLDGTAAAGNGGSGVYIEDAPDNQIGGARASEGNVISGNTAAGITVTGENSAGTIIQGNSVGVNASGDAPIPNSGDGIAVEKGQCEIGGDLDYGNIIVSNGGSGIAVSSSDGVIIQGNSIGILPEVKVSFGNTAHGIHVTDSTGIVIGGDGVSSGAGNTISSNTMHGVLIDGASSGITLIGNRIGTDAAGNQAFGNGGDGVRIENAPDNAIDITGDAPSVHNIISGNSGCGVLITGAGASGNAIRGAFIGVNSDGSVALPNSESGVRVDEAPNTQIGAANQGNVISGNTSYGIYVYGATNTLSTTIQGNRIGTNAIGETALGNGASGIMFDSAPGNTVGGAAPGEENLISGNGIDGIYIYQSGSCEILGNRIGANDAGVVALPNAGKGIHIFDSSGTILGGDGAGQGNLISGNTSYGIRIGGAPSFSNIVYGNLIGTDLDGTAAIPNEAGIVLDAGANMNSIGGSTAGAGNLISGNTYCGIFLSGTGTENNAIKGNIIGAQSDGLLPLGNGDSGVFFDTGANNNAVGGPEAGAGNIIAFNLIGVFLRAAVAHVPILRNSIHDNLFNGIDMAPGANGGIAAPVIAGIEPLAGTAPPNALVDFYLDDADEGRTYLVSTTADGSGNFTHTSDLIPYIGQNITALATDIAELNTSEFSAPFAIEFDPTITVTDAADTGPNTLRAAIQRSKTLPGENTILFDLEKTTTIALASQLPSLDDTTGGTTIDGEGLVILDGSALSGSEPAFHVSSAGNILRNLTIVNFSGPAIMISGDNNRVAGCRLGNNGVSAMGNALGVYIYGGTNNLIGGDTPEDRNIISGNLNTGIRITNTSPGGNIVRGNYIGLDESGTLAIENGNYGVWVNCGGNTIGGSAAGQGNVIAGNPDANILIDNTSGAGNIILGNRIGTNVSGTSAIIVGDYTVGIFVTAVSTVIGGVNPGEGNLISGCYYGIKLLNAVSHDNTILGNLIGTDLSGTIGISNSAGGVAVLQGAHDNQIGGSAPGAGNLISGNGECGVRISGENTTGNVVQGNRIGTDITGASPITGNRQTNGIDIGWYASDNLIGGSIPAEGNVIAFNDYHGVRVDSACVRNTIRQNGIHGHTIAGIRLNGDANSGITPPVITALGSIDGAASPNATVEAFADEAGEGRILLGATTANGAGAFHFDTDITPLLGLNLTATQTDTDGNTSEFSEPYPAEGEGEGEGSVPEFHNADQDHNNVISLSELLRVIQFYNSDGYHCDVSGEDGYNPGPGDRISCPHHSSDYNLADWDINLSELLRLIQFYNSGGYHRCPGEGTEDGYCVGPP